MHGAVVRGADEGVHGVDEGVVRGLGHPALRIPLHLVRPQVMPPPGEEAHHLNKHHK